MNQKTFPYPLLRIGMIGGGQLGKMTAQVAKQMGFYVTVLDPAPHCPAAHIADAHIVGDFHDANKLTALANLSDVVTYELENIDTQTLKKLADDGHVIYPSPDTLEIIQDKLIQKQVLDKAGVPVPTYAQVDKLDTEYLATASYPFVQKARTGGYDGKGVVVLKSPADAAQALPVPSLVEQFIPFEKELAIMIARSPTGDIRCYPVVEMVFDDKTNICDIVAAPAQVSSDIAEKAREIAVHAIEAVKGVGVFGVEMFLTQAGDILVNEIAPRPHNSGHYTIEACHTCQFEQLVRVISGLPLGDAQLRAPAVMWNILGEAGYTGTPVVEGLHEALAIDGLAFHFYDKSTTKPSRKMGHITIVKPDLEHALKDVQYIKDVLKVKAEEA